MAYKYNVATGVTKIQRFVKTRIAAALGIVSSAAILAVVPLAAHAAPNTTNGFDQYGYNRTARMFNGPVSGWCEQAGRAADCQGAYSNDHLVMKWNKAWDDCNAAGENDASVCVGAYILNEWNGNVPGGSGETEHIKVIWVGSGEDQSPYWVDGGYPLWTYYEAIQDKGMAGGQQYVNAAATPQGVGYVKHL